MVANHRISLEKSDLDFKNIRRFIWQIYINNLHWKLDQNIQSLIYIFSFIYFKLKHINRIMGFWGFGVMSCTLFGSVILSFSSYFTSVLTRDGWNEWAWDYGRLFYFITKSFHSDGVPRMLILRLFLSYGTGFEDFFNKCNVFPLRSEKS